MATLIPAFGSCSSRMTSGENRFARRLQEKLEDDYICWYDVAVGERNQHPDFVVFHPSRGILILEVKDWKVDTLQSMDKQNATILTDQGIKVVLNPLEQARQYMFGVTRLLERDPQLTFPNGSLKGKPFIPYGHGVVLSFITRKQFETAELEHVLPPHLVICQDEMTETIDPEQFQQRLWAMFPLKFRMPLTLPQIDRIRWHLFPEIRMPEQQDLFKEDGPEAIDIPDVLRLMDLQQEQLARSLGAGHRVIHGVAGSGKTMILGYRAEHLAKICHRPILILCYNKTLAKKLASIMEAKGLQDKVHAVNFHAWCSRQLDAFNAGKPPNDKGLDAYFDACVERVIRSVENGVIPAAQYDAVMIDEGHDFKPEWLKLVVQMVNPATDSLLVMYDDAQSIYKGRNTLGFTFSSVGIQAKGRTTILKLNYRNTAEIFAVARAFADELFSAGEVTEDSAPTLMPMCAGRHGPKPLLVELPTLKDEARYIADRLKDANRTGTSWQDMAVIYRSYGIGEELAGALTRKGIPVQYKKSFDPNHDSVKLITMHSSKGLEFPLVCIPAVGARGKDAEEPQDEARLLYVAMTRATGELIMTHGHDSTLSPKLTKAMSVLQNL